LMQAWRRSSIASPRRWCPMRRARTDCLDRDRPRVTA
jgi:hypothetical protein